MAPTVIPPNESEKPQGQDPPIPRPIGVTLLGSHYADVELEWSHYAADPRNIIPALRLVSRGELVTVATVNLPEVGPDEGCILVKDWSGNEGLFDALVEAGVVSDTGVSIPVNQWGSVARQGRVLPPYDVELQAAIERGLSL